jgi:DNA recombination protein RmuC
VIIPYIILIGTVLAIFVLTVVLSLRQQAFMREQRQHSIETRQELLSIIRDNQSGAVEAMTGIARLTQDQLNEVARRIEQLTSRTETELKALQETVGQKLDGLRSDNSAKLEQIRVTVDEKLHATLEQRLGTSFKLVSDQLNAVNASLGEMRTLADGVGDLKRVLGNVKTRGILGEFQLHAILEDILAPDQYLSNVATRQGSSERVEYAIRLPGKDGEDAAQVLLPIDAKFPKEDYERMLGSQQAGDIVQTEAARKAIRVRVKGEAKDIASKYIDVPGTTDFAILFLPFEGLYAEVLNMPGIVEELQRDHHVVLAGPTTLAALLNSLQMGFKTLAIQKRSSEVWKVLGAVKTEFAKFGELLEKTKKKLDQASGELDLATRKSGTIRRRLVSVEALPTAEARLMLGELEVPEEEHEEGAT